MKLDISPKLSSCKNADGKSINESLEACFASGLPPSAVHTSKLNYRHRDLPTSWVARK